MGLDDATWSVLRHSGRNGAEWRLVLKDVVEDRARFKYGTLVIRLRQGGVRLCHGEKITKQVTAPRLRTRW